MRDVIEVTQEGDVDGMLTRLGVARQVTAQIGTDRGLRLIAVPRELVADLRAHLLEDRLLRFFGRGTWRRGRHGGWELTRFAAERFVVLEDTPIDQIARDLRALGETEWSRLHDPQGELSRLRRG